MTSSMVNRKNLKLLCLSLLDAVAVEHPAGHQSVYAARYVLRSASGEGIGLMFEKGEKSAANLWIARRYALDLIDGDIKMREYPAAALYKQVEKGEKRYGRHAALKAMRDLANADLLRFTIERPGQMQHILDRLVRG